MTKKFRRTDTGILYPASQEVKAPKDTEKVRMASICTLIAAVARLQDLTHKINYDHEYILDENETQEADFLKQWWINLGIENQGKIRDWIRDITSHATVIENATHVALMDGGKIETEDPEVRTIIRPS